MKIQGNILYKFYYKERLVYLGRTKQPLQDRIRGHLFQKPLHRALDINRVTKIEYAEFQTEADMNIYEIYYINKLKPPFNVDDKTPDELTVKLPDVEFKEFVCHLWDKWKYEISARNSEFRIKKDRYKNIKQERSILRSDFKMGQISKSEFSEKMESLKIEEAELRKYLYG